MDTPPCASRRAVVVGGSLAGLMSALALASREIEVTVLERSADSGRTGAALHVDRDLLERLTRRAPDRSGSSIPAGVQTWHTVHRGLLAAAKADPRIQVLPNTTVVAVGQDDTGAWATTRDGRTIQGDVLVGADGHRSIVRARVSPDRPDATFAGYVIWIGLADEADLPAHRWPRGVDFLSSPLGPVLGYPLPASNGSAAPGHRQLGWAWYDADHNRLLRSTGAVNGSVVHHTLHAEDIPDRVFRELATHARAALPPPWRDAVLDCIERRAVIGTPIGEYVPDRLVNGRLALVGDAAHVPTPMTGSGFSASLLDAEALADALTAQAAVPDCLWRYEQQRLRDARELVRAGQGFSESFAQRGIR